MTGDMTTWPGGASCALVINVMYERWEPGVAPGLGPMGNPLPPGATDHQAIGWADYGRRTGIWEVLALLERESVAASFSVSGVLTESDPESLVAIAEAGHELVGHAWAQNRIPAMLARDEEKAEIDRCASAIRSVSGQRPRGWISPRCTPSARTAELLAAAGFEWFGDVFDADLPYWLDTGAGRIAALPFGLEVNDLPMTVRHGRPMSDLTESFEFEARARAVRRPLSYIDVTVHAHVGCRPSGLLALREIIASARRMEMWLATRGDIVDRFADSE